MNNAYQSDLVRLVLNLSYMTDADFDKFEFSEDAVLEKYRLSKEKLARIEEWRNSNFSEIQIKKRLRSTIGRNRGKIELLNLTMKRSDNEKAKSVFKKFVKFES